MYSDEDLILISGLQHISFCERQWALSYLEQEWKENILTVEGKQLHDFVHAQGAESRGNLREVRGLRLRSLKLGLYGVADLVEFHLNDRGVRLKSLASAEKRWMPYPVEYKRGNKKFVASDEVQLCAQAMCLEEMLEVDITIGAIYYGQPRRRTEIKFSDSLRGQVMYLITLARELYENKRRPVAKVGGHCKNCSLVDICMPDLTEKDMSNLYLEKLLYEISAEKANPL